MVNETRFEQVSPNIRVALNSELKGIAIQTLKFEAWETILVMTGDTAKILAEQLQRAVKGLEH